MIWLVWYHYNFTDLITCKCKYCSLPVKLGVASWEVTAFCAWLWNWLFRAVDIMDTKIILNMFLHNPQGIDVKSMGRIFIGLVKCGAWGCFDEFNRLEEAVLSAVSMQIQTIQAALKTKLPSTELLGRQVGVGRLSHRRRLFNSAASPPLCVRRSDTLSAPSI